jgi:enamine deaminase RidA (YjgF/YER057c/UK114 family)
MTARKTVSTASPYEDLFGFCRAVRTGKLISIAGTAPIGDDGRTVGVGDPAMQARRCFHIARQSLEQLGASLHHVVRTRMYLTRMADWEIIGRVHGEFFGDVRPVSTMVEVSGLIDADWLVEIEMDAVVDDT